jgi:hypothetical protein
VLKPQPQNTDSLKHQGTIVGVQSKPKPRTRRRNKLHNADGHNRLDEELDLLVKSIQVTSKLKSYHEALTAFLPNCVNVKSDAGDPHEAGVSLELELPITTMERLLACIDNVPVLLQQLKGDRDDLVFELAVGYDILPFVDDGSGYESLCGFGSKVRLLLTDGSGNEEALWIYGFSDKSDLSETWVSRAKQVLRTLRLQIRSTVVLQLSKENVEDESLEPFLTLLEEIDGGTEYPATVSIG